jgi:hypothetical protein
MKPIASIETDQGELDSITPLLELRATNEQYNQPLLRIVVEKSRKGGAASIRIDDPNPDIELIELPAEGESSDPSDPGKGRYEIAVQSDKLQINGRDQANSRFEIIAVFQRAASGGNIGFRTKDQFGGGKGVIGIANAIAPPSGNPKDGGVLYVEDGALKYRGPGGKITVLAEPA